MNNITEYKTIFCGMWPDTEDYTLINFVKTEDLIQLSFITKTALEKLNNKFFEECFKRDHPLLSKNKIAFKMLCDFHPTCSWKVACSAFSKGIFEVKNIAFAKMALPAISKFYQSQIDQLEEKKIKLEEQLDLLLDDTIDAKKLSFEQSEAECATFFNTKWELEDALVQFHTPEEVNEIMAHYFEPHEQELFMLTDEELMNLLMEWSGNDGILNRKSIQSYLSLIQFRKVNPQGMHGQLLRKSMECRKDYHELVYDKEVCINALIHINRQISLIDLSSLTEEEREEAAKAHAGVLSAELHGGKDIEFDLINEPILAECKKLILQLIAEEKKPNSEMFTQIKELLNAFYSNRTYFVPNAAANFWNAQFQMYTNGGSDPENWTQQEWDLMLNSLNTLCSNELGLLQQRIKSYTPSTSPI